MMEGVSVWIASSLCTTDNQLTSSVATEEGINYLMALSYFGRLRLAKNLAPLLQHATGLRRVVSAFAGAKEGSVYQDAWQQGQENKVPLSGARGHAATMSEIFRSLFFFVSYESRSLRKDVIRKANPEDILMSIAHPHCLLT